MKKIAAHWKKYRFRFLLGLTFIAIIFVIKFYNLDQYLTLEKFKQNREEIKNWVDSHYLKAVLLYIFSYTTIVISSIPIAGILTLISGFLFGTWLGAIYSNIGAIIGASFAFLMARYILGNFIQERYAKQLVHFNNDIEKYGALYLLTIHLAAFVPFFVINTLAGLTRIPLSTFIWTTSVGIFPGSLIYTYAGKQL